MNSTQKKELRYAAVFVCLIILVAMCGYISGHREASKLNRNTELKQKIDSLETSLEVGEKIQKDLFDSINKKDTPERFDKIELINEVKKAIRNEIKKSTQSVYVTPDSLHQHFIDSIRARKGFGQIQY